eukprot:scaffold79261_cov33-Phaeocystis_antarctica.AAC.1
MRYQVEGYEQTHDYYRCIWTTIEQCTQGAVIEPSLFQGYIDNATLCSPSAPPPSLPPSAPPSLPPPGPPSPSPPPPSPSPPP